VREPRRPQEIWLFEEVTAYGASGAPTRGTPEKGQLIVDAVLEYMVSYMRRFEARGLVYDPEDEPAR